MEAIRNALLPRRLTQMYADTKRSYEHIVQTNCSIINPQLSSLFLKLRIQKDRLFAWGLEWRDSGAATQSGDIDGSLDRAGISDLVASIMSSIGQLLNEAERMQPGRPRELRGTFSDDKISDSFTNDVQWTSKDIVRLADIVKDITTSIDTLCDLSRSQQQLSQNFDSHAVRRSFSKGPAVVQEKHHQIQPLPEKSVYKVPKSTTSLESSHLIASTRIHLNQLRIPEKPTTPGASPPSYESVAAGSEDRIFAYLTRHETWEELVLLDYGAVQDTDRADRDLISVLRFEALMDALRHPQGGAGSHYAGLLGWFEDSKRSRCAFVYQIPTPPMDHIFEPREMATPHTLLSFLQYAADTDSSNMPSLEDRFRLAFNLASAVLQLHAKGLTHRNINSNNIFFLVQNILSKPGEGKVWKTGVIRYPCLTSFDQRDEDSIAPHQEPLISSIYRHPRIERGQRKRYRPAHDIYSLGLILLEIGLWMPISSLWKTKYARLDFKLRLQTIYTKKLAAKCGSAYMRVVDYCLRAADGNSQAHSSAPQNSLGSQKPPMLQMDFYWKAIRKLERCCSIEDSDDRDEKSSQSDAAAESALPKVQVPSKDAEVEHQAPAPPPKINLQISASPDLNEDPKPRRQAKRKMKIWSHELPGPCTKYWYATMLPELERILKRIIDRWESYSIDLFMVGETPDSARPTIYMMCSSVEKVRKALQHVNKERRLFDIKVVKGEITRSKAAKKKRGGRKAKKGDAAKSEDGLKEAYRELNPCYQPKPACGASIGAYMDKQHLPPVSFGGTVLVDGEPFGMSVHHMIENDDVDLGLDDTVNLHRSMADDEEIDTSEFDEDITGHGWCSGNPPEALYPFEISEDEEEEDDLSADDDDDDSWLFDAPRSEDEFDELGAGDDEINMGDTIGIEPGQGKELFVTQPAIDDVDCNFFPNEEDMDDDHLRSHSFGHIHASSGLKRSTRGEVCHEIDWALIKVKEHRLRETNIVNGGARHCKLKTSGEGDGLRSSDEPSGQQSASYPCDVVKADDLGGLRVHALGRTSGLQTGTILPTMTMIKMPGRISASRSWQVMGNFGVGGDSGAWVMDNTSGRVCAHVLAWSARNNTAYIAPMEILLDDMAQALGAHVTLPGPMCYESIPTPKEAASKQSTSHQPKARESAAIIHPAQPSSPYPSSPPKIQRPISPPQSQPSSTSSHDSDTDYIIPPPHHPSKSRQKAYPSPSPSPPMATSPPCFPLIDNIAQQQRFSNPDAIRHHVNMPSTAAPSRQEILGRGVKGGGGGGRGRGGIEAVGMRGGGRGGVETRG